MASIINASSTGSGGLISTGDASGVLQLQNNGTVAVTVTGGNVGIGTTNPQANIEVSTSSPTYIKVTNTNGTAGNAGFVMANSSKTYYTLVDALNNYQIYDGTAGVQRATIDTSGNFNIKTSNAGITFANASAIASSTLNDYETGTWTPTATYGTGSATLSANGQYVKIGRLVTITYQLSFSGSSSTSGVQITNFPFSVGTGSGSGVMREGTQTGYFWTIVGTAGTASGYLFQYVNNQNLPNGNSSFTGTYSYYASF